MKTENRNVVRLTESQLKQIISESVRNVLKEIGDTSAGLGAVAKNFDRRTTQMRDVYGNRKSSVGDRVTSMGNTNQAQAYLAQAIKNAQEAGMSPNEIQQILQQNMGQNYNPTYDGENVTWNYKS